MHAGHILLDRPWQFDRRVSHDGYKKRYSFVLNKRLIVLAPLSPKKEYEDQIRILNDFKTYKEKKKECEKNGENKKDEKRKKIMDVR